MSTETPVETLLTRAQPDAVGPGKASWSFNGISRGLLTVLELHQRAEKYFLQQAGSGSLGETIPLSMLREILTALHFRDENTFLHSRRVSLIAMGIAQQLCWNKDKIKELEIAALLHDIGKIGIPDHLLYKPGRYSPEEYGQMRQSVEVAEDILQVCGFPVAIRRIVLEARRYYSGLEDHSRPVGVELSQGARVLAVADAFESLSREQVFRDAKTPHDILQFLRERSGTQYDPRMVETLERWLDNGGLQLLGQQVGKEASFAQSAQNGGIMLGAISTVFAELFALEQSYDGFLVTDADEQVVLANRGCLELFHHDPPLFEARAWTPELFPLLNFNHEPFQRGEYPQEVMRRNRRPMSMNVQIPGPGRRFEAAEVQSLPLFDIDGVFKGSVEFYKCKDRTRQQSHQFKELTLLASRDALTGVANRGELENQLSQLMNGFLEDTQAGLFSVIYLDIDHFKSINDTHGHAVGDEVLVELAKLLRQEAFSSELVARYGGEEFVILCPELELMQAAGRAERFRLEIARLRFPSAPELRITSSFGVAQIEEHDTLEAVLKRADKGLYESKRNGRNRTTVLRRKELTHISENADKQSKSSEEFVYKGEMTGVLPDEMLVMKLENFVRGEGARIQHVKKGFIRLKIGRRRLLLGWGSKPEHQPVQIEITGEADSRLATKPHTKQRLAIRITPIGTVPSHEAFQLRARQVYRHLRAHLMTD